MQLNKLRLKKNEDKRIRAGHVWIYSNEVDTTITPLKNFQPGQEVLIEANDKTLLGAAYVNPHSLITARLFTRNSMERLDQGLLVKRLEMALAFRKYIFHSPYYRLVFGESDNLPGLIVDRFNDIFSLQINTAGMEIKTKEIIASMKIVFPSLQSILLRNDSPARQLEGLESMILSGAGVPPENVLVEENGLQFVGPLWKGQKTGWFYDHRLNRARLTDYVLNKKVLDVFSYVGAWGLTAAKWGALAVTCIDASPLAIHWIKENASSNNLAEKVKVIEDNAFDALKKLAIDNEKFDLIVLDPPAFAKKQKDKKAGLIAYQRINESAIKLLNLGGILISCSCSMQMTMEEFIHVLRRASFRTHTEFQVIERGHQAPDHPVHLAIPETDYLKMLILRRIR